MLATGVADVILEERPKLARLRHADRIEQCPLSGVTRKTFATLSSSQFEPRTDIGQHCREWKVLCAYKRNGTS
jgi:hypothetical protein